ncbi:RNA-directed DNA polymerase [Methylobacterium sp. Leaf466]|uniref:RNA-directed DNA polymerase n=1 Tax=Methylobacterium sp. Leaf466 TaxID=1736386 RepID=UPI000B01BA93|nr:RNA-directed DNA polymerase [Methylobacterium sp. Leaf466]
MVDKLHSLLSTGFFPEVVPPCFSAIKLADGTIKYSNELDGLRWTGKHTTKPAPYSSTKRNGHRRQFATCHPASYFFICRFIEDNWGSLEDHFKKSKISLSTPNFNEGPLVVRPISFTPFGELDKTVHRKILYSPFLLRADVAQFFPSIYTHSIPWALHGKESSKNDFDSKSSSLPFNELDFQVRRAQDGQTRGVLIGPDAHRIIAEAVITAADIKFQTLSGDKIIGGVRHVDDYYLGVSDEADAALVLSHLRESLAEFELFANDEKTKIIRTDQPSDDSWPSQLRTLTSNVEIVESGEAIRNVVEITISLIKSSGSQSPLKLLLRELDRKNISESDHFDILETYLMRFIYHFSHAIDYICLVMAKRAAIALSFDKNSWETIINFNLKRFASYRYHHECAWLLWLSHQLDIYLSDDVISQIERTENPHLISIIVSLYANNKIKIKRNFELPSSDTGSQASWMVQLELRKYDIIKQKFSGPYGSYLDKISDEKIGIIDLNNDLERLSSSDHSAIESSRWGYEAFDQDKIRNIFESHPSSIDDY